MILHGIFFVAMATAVLDELMAAPAAQKTAGKQ